MTRKTWSEVIMGILAVVSIILVAVESLVSVSKGTLTGIYIADFIICALFAWDFIQRLRSSEDKSRFFKTNGFELLAMIPAVALYALGTIPAISTAFRSLRLIRVIRVIFMLARMRRAMSKSAVFVKSSNLLMTFGITIFIIFFAAFTVLLLEGGTPGAEINNFSDAVWWSISTVTTVGYGDIVPNSTAGRIMGMVLMVVGIGVMAGFISQVSAALVESRMKRKPTANDLKTSIVTEIKNRIDNIEKLDDGEVALLLQMIKSLRLKRDDNL